MTVVTAGALDTLRLAWRLHPTNDHLAPALRTVWASLAVADGAPVCRGLVTDCWRRGLRVCLSLGFRFKDLDLTGLRIWLLGIECVCVHAFVSRVIYDCVCLERFRCRMRTRRARWCNGPWQRTPTMASSFVPATPCCPCSNESLLPFLSATF